MGQLLQQVHAADTSMGTHSGKDCTCLDCLPGCASFGGLASGAPNSSPSVDEPFFPCFCTCIPWIKVRYQHQNIQAKQGALCKKTKSGWRKPVLPSLYRKDRTANTCAGPSQVHGVYIDKRNFLHVRQPCICHCLKDAPSCTHLASDLLH